MKQIDTNHKPSNAMYNKIVKFFENLEFDTAMEMTNAIQKGKYKLRGIVPKDEFVDTDAIKADFKEKFTDMPISTLLTSEGIDLQLSRFKGDADWVYFADIDTEQVYLRREWLHVVDVKAGQ